MNIPNLISLHIYYKCQLKIKLKVVLIKILIIDMYFVCIFFMNY